MHLLENTGSRQPCLSDAIIHHLLTSFKVSAANHTARKQITDLLPVSHLEVQAQSRDSDRHSKCQRCGRRKPGGVTRCWCVEGTQHFLRDHCEELQRHLSSTATCHSWSATSPGHPAQGQGMVRDMLTTSLPLRRAFISSL